MSYIADYAWVCVVMEFLFECSTWYLASLQCSLVRYQVEHSKRNSISTSSHVLFYSMYYYFNYLIDLFSSEILAILLSTNSKLNKVFDWLIDWSILMRTLFWQECRIIYEATDSLALPWLEMWTQTTKLFDISQYSKRRILYTISMNKPIKPIYLNVQIFPNFLIISSREKHGCLVIEWSYPQPSDIKMQN